MWGLERHAANRFCVHSLILDGPSDKFHNREFLPMTTNHADEAVVCALLAVCHCLFRLEKMWAFEIFCNGINMIRVPD